MNAPLRVTHEAGEYSILIQSGATSHLGDRVRDATSPTACMLAIDSAIVDTHGAAARQSLESAGIRTACHAIEAHESLKTLSEMQRLIDALLGAKIDRAGVVIAMGGGIVCDLAGLAAATFIRGINLVLVPTTLLAMVDASIGGKTGVNHPLPEPQGGLGKNLVGAFKPPAMVISDPRALDTLPAREIRCGLAECIKHGLIADADLVHAMPHLARAALAHEEPALTDLIRRCAAIKATIVSRDERETGERALLNLGHTFAHAIESHTSLGLKHGEAVAIGLIAAAHCSHATGKLAASDRDLIERTIADTGLPTRLPRPVPVDSLLRAMQYDKKSRGGELRLVLMEGIGRAVVCEDVPETTVRAAWVAVGAGA